MAKKTGEFLGDVEVTIVGSGPAGCSTALHLLRFDPELAAKSIVLEKSQHPREKICGGALTLNAERIMADLEIPLEIPSAPVHHVRLVYGKACIDLPEGGCAKRVIRRCDLDALLFRAVCDRGIRTMENIRVKRVIRRPDHLLVVTDRGHFKTQVVVGCDGVGAVIRKTSGFRPGKMGRMWVAEVPTDPADSQAFQEQVLIIDLTYVRSGLRGYYWEFPCYIDGNPFLSTGIVDSNTKGSTRIGSPDLLTEILDRRGLDSKRALRKAFPIRHFDGRGCFARPRMLLAGDALGSDPLFSEGISQALEFGRLAAQAVFNGFQRRDLSFSGYTRDIMRSRVGKELSAYAQAARLFYGPRAELLLSMLYEKPELRSLIGCSYAGTQDMHQNMLKLAKSVAGHLWHRKQHLSSFRQVAAISDSEPVGTKKEAVST